jgi:hypothetical protein
METTAEQTYSQQGDQTSCLKIDQCFAQTFLINIIHYFLTLKKKTQTFGYFYKFRKKLPKVKKWPNGRKFAQFGHSDSHRCQNKLKVQ